MGSGTQKHGIAVYGAGAVGSYLARTLGVEAIRRGEPADRLARYALVTWPAQTLADANELVQAFPGLVPSTVTTFCNGVWVDPRLTQGCAYIRVRAGQEPTGSPKFRVANEELAKVMRLAGLDVTASRDNHRAYILGKALYIVPLAVACGLSPDLTAREVYGNLDWAKAWNRIISVACSDTQVIAFQPQINRASYLLQRLPKNWKPSSSPQEIAFFRQRLGI